MRIRAARLPAAFAAVAMAGAALVAQADTVIRITAGHAEIRAEPSTRGPVFQDVSEGTYLILIKDEGAWLQVQLPPNPKYPGLRAIGYVEARFARRVTGAEAAKGADLARRPRVKPPGDTIVVGAEIAGKTVWLKPQATRAVSVAGASTKLEALAAREPLLAALAADTATPAGRSAAARAGDVMWVWATPAGPAAPVLGSRQPSFWVSYGEVPGLNPEQWVPAVVRLVPAGSEWRLVSALPGVPSAPSGGEEDWYVRRDRVQIERPATVTGLAHGIVRLTFAAPLDPGEYAVIIRPAFFWRQYSGRAILGDSGPGVAFGAVWKFRVS